MNKETWIDKAIEQHRRDTANLPKWMLNAYAPKPPPEEARQRPKK
jgi:hypothetical protein